MAAIDLMSLIDSHYQNMTKAEKKVADFIKSSPDKALNATITSLAKYCDVGDTSVFRFCRTLNFNGYQEFRIALALSLGDTPVVSEPKNVNINNSASEMEVAQKVRIAYENAISKTFSSLNYDAIHAAVQLLIHADYIYLFGAGGSGISALEMHTKFSKIMANISFDLDLHQQLIKASLLRPGNVSVIFSNSGITKDAITIARMSHENGAQVIFITDFLHTPAQQYCDVLLHSGATEGPLDGGSITAKTSQMFMMDLLYSEVYRRMGSLAPANKKRTAQIIADKML
jgi:DNA-binding MurR/RpiR family transcriptional regulator